MLKYKLCYFTAGSDGKPLLAVVDGNDLDFTSVVRMYDAPSNIYVMIKAEVTAKWFSTIKTNGNSNGESKTYSLARILRDGILVGTE